jgi:hypothetical protein
MRDYSKVSPQFWIGATGKKIRSYGIEAQLVSLYLLTCSHANMLGMYYLPKIYIAHECGLSLEGASKGLTSAIEAGFCSYDEASEMVWVYEMATFQIADQLKENDKRVLGIQNEYETLPECPFLLGFFNKYKDQFLMTKARGIQAPSKPLVSQEQEQDQEQEQKQEQEQEGYVAEKSATPKKIDSETKLQAACRQTWKSYSDAYFNRYNTEPVRNQKVNSQIKQFVQRLGFDESHHVAAYFLKSNVAYYVQRGHTVDCLLSDAEKLRTEWVTNTSMTSTRAKQIDKHDANRSAVDEAMKILEAKNAKGN